jgi:hypothetical protein
MSNLEPTKEDYDSLIYKLATLEAELGQARKLLEAPARRPSWWKRYWVGVAVVVLVMVLVVGVGADSSGFKFTGNKWLTLSESAKLFYVDGYFSGVLVWKAMAESFPKEAHVVGQCVGKWSSSQALAVVKKYLNDNPQEQHKEIFLLVWEAWLDACQKRGQPKP